MTTLRRVLLASASAAALAGGFGSQASAQTLYGGGASLPSVAFRQLFNCFGADIRSATDPFAAPGCTAPLNNPARLTYATTGSGAGLRAYALRDASQLAPVSGSNFVPYADNGTPAAAPLVGILYPFPAHHFSSSESPLVPVGYTHPKLPGVTITNSANQTLDCFYGNSATTGGACTIDQRVATGEAMALPSFSTTVGIVANFGGVAKTINLSRTSLCGVFTGNIADWNSVEITKDNGGVSVTGGVSRPIQVVVRSDGSGTTFLFAQALESMCTQARTKTTNYPAGFDYTFGVNTLPAWKPKFWRAPGNNGVAATVASVPWSVGYLSPDFFMPQVSTVYVYAKFSVVNGNGQIVKVIGNGASSTNPLPFNAYLPAAVQNAKNNYIKPTPAAATSAMSDAVAPAAGAARLNPVNWINGALIPNPLEPTAYPISGFGWFLNYTCYSNTAVANALRSYQSFHLFATGQAKAILNANGFGVLPGPILNAARAHALSTAASQISKAGAGAINPNCTSKTGA